MYVWFHSAASIEAERREMPLENRKASLWDQTCWAKVTSSYGGDNVRDEPVALALRYMSSTPESGAGQDP